MEFGRYLDKFYDYTIQDGSSFKIAFGDVVVSVACHNDYESLVLMKGNGLVGKGIDAVHDRPRDLSMFTFDNGELMIFDQITLENLTEKYCKDIPNYDDYMEIVYGVIPFELVDILVRVRNDVKEEEENGK